MQRLILNICQNSDIVTNYKAHHILMISLSKIFKYNLYACHGEFFFQRQNICNFGLRLQRYLQSLGHQFFFVVCHYHQPGLWIILRGFDLSFLTFNEDESLLSACWGNLDQHNLSCLWTLIVNLGLLSATLETGGMSDFSGQLWTQQLLPRSGVLPRSHSVWSGC